jgi:hypothetical protein
MLTQAQISEIKKLEENFLTKIESLKKQYQTEFQKVITDIDTRKVEQLRKELLTT